MKKNVTLPKVKMALKLLLNVSREYNDDLSDRYRDSLADSIALLRDIEEDLQERDSSVESQIEEPEDYLYGAFYIGNNLFKGMVLDCTINKYIFLSDAVTKWIKDNEITGTMRMF